MPITQVNLIVFFFFVPNRLENEESKALANVVIERFKVPERQNSENAKLAIG